MICIPQQQSRLYILLLNFILIDNYALTCKPDPYPFVLGINTQSLLLGYKLGQYSVRSGSAM